MDKIEIATQMEALFEKAADALMKCRDFSFKHGLEFEFEIKAPNWLSKAKKVDLF